MLANREVPLHLARARSVPAKDDSPHDRSARTSGSPRAPIPAWRKAIFGALVTVGFFVLLELAAGLAGVEPALYSEDPYVGFARHLPLFIVDDEAAEPGTLRTAPNKESFFSPQRFRLAKAPDEYRIFALGGSTTYGRPYYGDAVSFPAWLRALLPEADPSRSWQVINAGGISYASYRVALLMEELVEYEPDLFIVYTGHNEFLERRTYADLIDVPEPTSRLVSFASRSRAFSALRSFINDLRASGSRAGSAGSAPESEAATSVLGAEVEVILDRAIGPADYTRDDALARQIDEHLRFNLGRMVEIAASVGARVLFVVPASNLGACSPFKSEFADETGPEAREAVRTMLREAGLARRAGDVERALQLLDDAIALDDRYADLHYQRGRALEAAGRFDEARVAYQGAVDEDVCPLRARTITQETVREVAAERGAWLLDFAKILADDAGERVPGDSYFLDHVHLDIPTYRRLALEIIETLRAEGVVDASAPLGEEAIRRVSERVEAGLDVEAHARAMRNLARVFAWAGKYEDSTRAARRSIALYADDYEPHLLIGRNAMKLGQGGVAVRALRRAIRLVPKEPGPHVLLGMQLLALDRNEEAIRQLRIANKLDPNEPGTEAALAKVLSEQGEHAEAVPLMRRAASARTRSPAAQSELGEVLRRAGELQEARKAYERALELDAAYEPALLEIVKMMRREEGDAAALARLEAFADATPGARQAHAVRDALRQRIEVRAAGAGEAGGHAPSEPGPAEDPQRENAESESDESSSLERIRP